MKYLGSAIFLLLILALVVLSLPKPTGRTQVPATHPPSTATTAPSTRAAATRPHDSALRLIRGQTGFWRLAQDDSGVWWFVDPSGKRQFLSAVANVQPAMPMRETVDLNTWAMATLKRVREVGLDAIGPGSHPIFHSLDVPMLRDLNIWPHQAGARRLFYSFDWLSAADQTIKSQVELLGNNRNLVGYFLDSDLDFSDAAAGPCAYFDHLAPDDPNRLEVLRTIQSLWSSPASFNADWHTAIKDFSELNTWPALPRVPAPAYARLRSAWVSHLSHDYFAAATSRVRYYDPNHLILGIRYSNPPPKEVIRASREFTDAQSINCYASDAKLDLEQFRTLYEQSRQPVFLSEYAFHALDNRSQCRNLANFPGQVPDQQARAKAYELFTTGLARLPFVVGADWTAWADDPAAGRLSDGRDANVGILDVTDQPYDVLVNSIRQTAPLLASLHADSAGDFPADVFRPSFATRPLMNVPFLTKPIVLDGDLSDWPATSRLQGLRSVPTVGSERYPQPLPQVRLAWSAEGLYLGMEIFDADLSVSAPSAWWAGDYVQFYLSTRPVASDQDRYDPYCHHFFFTPPTSSQDTLMVGQWHHPGDSLNSHLIGHPDIKSAARLLPGRYVVELLIPAKALNGWEPSTQPALAFNVVTHNHQHAVESFWSVPPQLRPDQHPRTWGSLYLESASKDLAAQSSASPSAH